MNEIIENIKTRKSVKKYKSDMVNQEMIDIISEAGTYAPSGMNKQSPIILQITNKEMRDKLSKINEGTGVYRKIKTLKPNILLLDMKMPGKNGIQILDEIKDDTDMSNLKVIVYSGEQKYIQEAIRYKNVVKFLDKGRMTIEDVALELDKW